MAECYKQDISVLFLDVDGVLNINNRENVKRNKGAKLSVLRTHVEMLKDILTSATNCFMVISSAWRLNKYSLRLLKRNLVLMGDIDVETVIIGQTPFIPKGETMQNAAKQRIFEIKSYLQTQSKYNIVSFCVIDDLDLSGIGSNFVQINGKYGLTQTNVFQILSVLNQGSVNPQKLMKLKEKPRIKLLFIACPNDYDKMDTNRLQIILKKTECTLVIKAEHIPYTNIESTPFTINCFTEIMKYTTDLQRKYNIQSWAVLDYINLCQTYAVCGSIITRRFVQIDPKTDLSLNDVLSTISILNKWT